MMRKYIYGFMVALMMTGQVFAQEVPIQFEAESMLINDQENKTTLSGNVKLVRGNLNLAANEIDIFSKETSEGKSEFTNLTAHGGVRVKSGSQIITAEKMVYNAQNEIAEFTGNVSIKSGVNIAKGNRAVVNIATGVHRLYGPVRGTISGEMVSGRLP